MRRINFGTPETNMLVREINAWRGGLLLLRHVTPLTRRYVVHFCSGAYTFSETDQTDDLKAITVPTLVMQGDDDQIVPYRDASLLQAKLVKNATLKVYKGFPHGMATTHADVINADLLAFIKS